MYKPDVVYTHKEYYSPGKKNNVLTYATAWVNFEDLMLNELCKKANIT
jgi:hypothetical protein